MTISAAVQNVNPHPIQSPSPINSGDEKTVNGTVSSSKNGDGTFSKVMEEVNGQKTIDKTVTYANGKTMESQKTITVNPDGSKTITRVGANGKTSTIQESKVKNSDGSYTISKETTNAHGGTKTMTDTMTKSATGQINQTITSTNAKGESETLDRTTTSLNGVRTVSTTGTGYDGSAINNETTWTTLA